MESALKELLYLIEEQDSRIRQEVLQAQHRLDTAMARDEVAVLQVEDAREGYRLALRRYDAQVGTNLDVLDARTALINSLNMRVNAVYDIASAQSELIYAIGGDTK